MTKKLVALVLLSVAPASAAAQTMPLSQFVQRGTKLEKKGPLALFNRGEINLLMGEMEKAGLAVRAERLAAEKAGRAPLYCPPAKGQAMGAQKTLAELRLISRQLGPTATTTDGMRALVIKRYPCR